MAIKYFCDGCDREIKMGDHETGCKVHVKITGAGMPEDYYELCLGCTNHLKDGASPKQWPRMASEASCRRIA